MPNPVPASPLAIQPLSFPEVFFRWRLLTYARISIHKNSRDWIGRTINGKTEARKSDSFYRGRRLG